MVFIINVQMGFTGGSETWEFARKMDSMLHQKAIKKLDNPKNPDYSWVDECTFTFKTIADAKRAVEGLKRSTVKFWFDDKTKRWSNLSMDITDKTKQIIPSGEWSFTNKETDELVMVTIDTPSGIKKESQKTHTIIKPMKMFSVFDSVFKR